MTAFKMRQLSQTLQQTSEVGDFVIAVREYYLAARIQRLHRRTPGSPNPNNFQSLTRTPIGYTLN